MALQSGSRLGHYTIVGQLGAGGMGEVYRARDTRLNRDVAIKIIPDELAGNHERLARLQREAQSLAALNHPHIAHVYGFEEAGGTRAIVMELVEGEDLASRLSRGKLRVGEALQIAQQIAEAIEAAHDKGIVHRDLKPSNIMLDGDGRVRILDFGLATTAETVSDDSSSAATITSPAKLTGHGVIVGTPAYMSPEQVTGRPADKRADVWAFGCVLFEMLTGGRAFDGRDTHDVMMSIAAKEPDFSLLPETTPANIVTLIRRCLDKNRKRRLSDMSAARLDLEDSLHPRAVDVPKGGLRTRGVWLGAGAAIPLVIALIGTAAGIGWWTERRPTASQPRPQHFAIGVEPGERLWIAPGGSVAISPDGQTVAYLASQNGVRQLRLWSVERGTSTAIVTQGLPASPFFSPDGKAIGFFDESDATLRRVSVTGTEQALLARVGVSLRGAAWGDNGMIVFATSNPLAGLLQVSANGGEVITLTQPDSAGNHRWPVLLPHGRFVIFSKFAAGNQGKVALFDLVARTERVIVDNAIGARFLSTGHLLFVSQGRVAVAPFDAEKGEVTGAPVAVLDQIPGTGVGLADLAVSDNGSLVFVPKFNIRKTLAWVDLQGRISPLMENEGFFAFPRLSPDGKRVAFSTRSEQGGVDVWIRDLGRQSNSRVTSQGQNLWPIWSRDGRELTYGSNRLSGDSFDLYSRPADLGDDDRRILDGAVAQPVAWTNSGEMLYAETDAKGGASIWITTIGSTPRPIVVGPQNRAPRLSPDGQWLAYVADTSGESRIHARRFADNGEIIDVSPGRGTEPIWSRDGSRIYYRDGTRLISIDFKTKPTVSVGEPRVLFTAAFDGDPNAVGVPNYDVSEDGSRFLMVGPSDNAPSLRFVQNWFQEIRAASPRDR